MYGAIGLPAAHKQCFAWLTHWPCTSFRHIVNKKLPAWLILLADALGVAQSAPRDTHVCPCSRPIRRSIMKPVPCCKCTQPYAPCMMRPLGALVTPQMPDVAEGGVLRRRRIGIRHDQGVVCAPRHHAGARLARHDDDWRRCCLHARRTVASGHSMLGALVEQSIMVPRAQQVQRMPQCTTQIGSTGQARMAERNVSNTGSRV